MIYGYDKIVILNDLSCINSAQILCYDLNMIGSYLMQLMSMMSDCHMELQDEELAFLSDMRAGRYDGRRFYISLFPVSPGAIMAMSCQIKQD